MGLAAARQWFSLPVNSPPPPQFPFTETPGISANIDPNFNCLDFFELFFDDFLVQHIASETNRYASDKMQGRAKYFMAWNQSE